MDKLISIKDKYVKQWMVELSRYVIAGGLAFILDFSVLIFLNKILGVYYLYAAGFGLIIGLLTTYILSVMWVFDKRSVTNPWSELIIFIAIGAVGFIINEVVMWLSVENFYFSVATSKIVSTAIVFVWNFIARKVILFGNLKKIYSADISGTNIS